MSHIFISYSTKDGCGEACQLVDALEAVGWICWIAPRDMKPGFPYSGQIVTAIRESRGLVLVLTPVANQSPDVLGEVTNAQNARKLIVPLVVQGTQPSDDLIYFLAMRQQFVWTDAKSAAAVLGEVFKQERGAVSMSEVDTKLVLARGCISIGDADGALEILVEVLHEGSASQKQEAQQLIETLSL